MDLIVSYKKAPTSSGGGFPFIGDKYGSYTWSKGVTLNTDPGVIRLHMPNWIQNSLIWANNYKNKAPNSKKGQSISEW